MLWKVTMVANHTLWRCSNTDHDVEKWIVGCSITVLKHTLPYIRVLNARLIDCE